MTSVEGDMRRGDALVRAVNQAPVRLLADGTIQKIFAKDGITDVPPLRP